MQPLYETTAHQNPSGLNASATNSYATHTSLMCPCVASVLAVLAFKTGSDSNGRINRGDMMRVTQKAGKMASIRKPDKGGVGVVYLTISEATYLYFMTVVVDMPNCLAMSLIDTLAALSAFIFSWVGKSSSCRPHCPVLALFAFTPDFTRSLMWRSNFGIGGVDAENQLAHCSSRIYVFLVADKINAQILEQFEMVNQHFQRAGETIKLPDEHHIKMALFRVVQKTVKALRCLATPVITSS